MGDLTLFNDDNANAGPAGFVPRSGELVSAKFSADDAWYRAKVRRSHPGKKEAEVLYIDCTSRLWTSCCALDQTDLSGHIADGNTETLPFSRLRPLPAEFKTLEGQAKDATLSFVSLLDWRTEYGEDARARFSELCEGQQLVANIDQRDPNLLHLSLFDPNDPAALSAHENSINVQLVREGLARIDKRSRFRAAYPNVVKALDVAQQEARRTRAGAYELGDVRPFRDTPAKSDLADIVSSITLGARGRLNSPTARASPAENNMPIRLPAAPHLSLIFFLLANQAKQNSLPSSSYSPPSHTCNFAVHSSFTRCCLLGYSAATEKTWKRIKILESVSGFERFLPKLEQAKATSILGCPRTLQRTTSEFRRSRED